ncbi:hypothetical protein O181_100400 [Austropuccinia psidii MF-1]|uniref:Uncharacterized protein n=1 Tax=Austropuccinia psidii MF-1 TaxID=1389203 RepID=A0A9Q3JCN4_9BASI|nr:hypothetical protein [Austropuccinia psidii MF-1]
MLLQRPQDMPPMCPSTLLMPSPTRLILSADDHPYTLTVSSQHASNAAPTLAQASTPPTILTLLKCSQDETTMPPPISALTTPSSSTTLLLTILTLLRRPQYMPPCEP